ncbi:MAG: hypothetical protein Kow0029_01020 [Candidatus Rifleibacteriota bacterium]
MISKKSLTKDQYDSFLELLAFIAWKLELKELRNNPKNLKLGINTAISIAETYAQNDLEISLKNDLRPYLEKMTADPQMFEELGNDHAFREKLREVFRFMQVSAENREIRSFSNFIYRFAYKLSEASGSTFSGLGKKVDAGEAEFLLVLKDELPR